MAATIQNVADEANVSISIASRALNRPHLVNSQTRRRVEATIWANAREGTPRAVVASSRGNLKVG